MRADRSFRITGGAGLMSSSQWRARRTSPRPSVRQSRQCGFVSGTFTLINQWSPTRRFLELFTVNGQTLQIASSTFIRIAVRGAQVTIAATDVGDVSSERQTAEWASRPACRSTPPLRLSSGTDYVTWSATVMVICPDDGGRADGNTRGQCRGECSRRDVQQHLAWRSARVC